MNELDFQLIWKHLLFDCSGLTTYSGAVVRILDTGTHNFSDGPDFFHARIAIDDVLLYGHVELHLKEEDWYRHAHHADANYNNVVLHVCLEHGGKGSVSCLSGDRVPQIALGNRIHMQGSNAGANARNELLPCHFAEPVPISEDVVRRQELRAYHAYFEDKIDGLMRWYDPSLGIRTAVKKAQLLGLAYYFGRPHNEEVFVTQAEKNWNRYESAASGSDFSSDSKTFLPVHLEEFDRKVNRKEVRPVMLSLGRLSSINTILNYYYDWIPQVHVGEVLKSHQASVRWIKTLTGIGCVTSSTIERCVLLPTLALWARLVHHRALFSEVQEYWMKLSAGHGKTVESKFPGFITQNVAEKGRSKNFLLYQYKSYCTERACDQCLFMKNAQRG